MQTVKVWNVEVEVISANIRGEYSEWDDLETFAKNAEVIFVKQNKDNKNIMIQIESHTVSSASAAAEHVIASLHTILGTLSVTSMNVTLEQEIDIPHNQEPEFESLIGHIEVSKRTGTSRSYGLDVTNDDTFPRPVINCKAGPLWKEKDVDIWWENNKKY